MLLRSTSTPTFESLWSVPTQSECHPEALDNEAKVSRETARSLSFSRARQARGSSTSPAVQNLSCSEVFMGEDLEREVNRDATSLWSRIEKVQSENDMRSRFLGPTSPAKVAASSLFSNRNLTAASDTFDSSRKVFLRPCFSRTQSSLISVPSLYFGASGLDRHDFIPELESVARRELADLANSDSPGCGRVFNLVGPTVDGSKNYFTSENRTEENESSQPSVSGRVLDVADGRISVRQEVMSTPATPLSKVCVCDPMVLDEEEDAACLGRLEGTRAQQNAPRVFSQVGDGTSACDSRFWSSTLPVDKEHPTSACYGGESGGGGGRPRSTCTSGSGSGAHSDSTDLYYREMLKANPGHPLLLRNYAQYLAEVKGDRIKAEEYYQRAILANPSDGEILAQYANLIWFRQRDYERAASYFERAVQAAPDNSYVVAAQACFLWNAEEEGQEEQGSGNQFPSLPSLVSASCR